MRKMSGSSCAAYFRFAVLGVIAALVVGLENDDLVFDHDNKLPVVDLLSEQENRESLFKIIWNWLKHNITDIFSMSQNRLSDYSDESVNINLMFNDDHRRKRNAKDDNEVSNDDSLYKSRKFLYKGDDEDDIGSGELEADREVEGSANSVDFHITRVTTVNNKNPVTESNVVDESNNYDETNVYRISIIIKEPYREEFENRDSEKFQKFAENLTKTVEEILYHNLKKDHHVAFVKMENAPDPFESYVHLDIRTMSSEADVRNTLDKHLNTYYSFGKFPVNPLTFRLRTVLECQHGEVTCDISRCILQTQRCDFKSDCEDGSDEAECKYPITSSI